MSGLSGAIASEPRASEHAARYEALRSHALDRLAPGARHGMALLLRQGMAAWIDAWSAVLEAPPPRSARGASPRPWPLPEESSVGLVHVLAAMALSHMQEVHP
jgi:hypothetical protein